MAIIPRAFDDILIDRMKAALVAFEAEQVAQDATVGFRVERDRIRPPAMREIPLVNLWLERIDPQAGGSSGRLNSQELARVAVDCYAKSVDEDDDGEGDAEAMSRLYYLKEQVRYALYRLVNADFGFPPGTIGRKRWPSWQIFQNDLRLPEAAVVAGRWSVEVEYNWTPEDISGIALDEIAVDAGRWSGLYTFGG